jgi:hypothetical protein
VLVIAFLKEATDQGFMVLSRECGSLATVLKLGTGIHEGGLLDGGCLM